jgi:hypothetical protein
LSDTFTVKEVDDKKLAFDSLKKRKNLQKVIFGKGKMFNFLGFER